MKVSILEWVLSFIYSLMNFIVAVERGQGRNSLSLVQELTCLAWIQAGGFVPYPYLDYGVDLALLPFSLLRQYQILNAPPQELVITY